MRKAAGLASNLLRFTVNRSPEFMVVLFVSHIRPISDYCSCIWNVGHVSDLALLETVQRRWAKNVVGFSNLSYAERLRSLNLFSIKGRLLRSDLIRRTVSRKKINFWVFCLKCSSIIPAHCVKISEPCEECD